MPTRRVVTGQDESGRSRAVQDAQIESQPAPSGSTCVVWGYDDGPFALPSDGTQPAFTSWFPPPHGLRVMTALIDPGAQATADSYQGAVPDDLAAAMRHGSDRPGFHVTDTVDIAIVLEGEIVLELDDGEVTLRRGDIVIQNGTAHAWRPSGSQRCEMAFVSVGARREERSSG